MRACPASMLTPAHPRTEITEYIQRSPEAAARGIHREWSANEKTAMESALGMSYAGKRAMVCMKHVGLNVAADPFMNSAVTGAHGGLIYVIADDPSMHSSQNEQDTRFFGRFAMIPILEPSNQQEAYDAPFYAFDLSEKYGIPVLIRITTTRSRIPARTSPAARRIPENALNLPATPRQFLLLPAISRQDYARSCSRSSAILKPNQKARPSTVTRTAAINVSVFWRAASPTTT